jgi:predicted nucleic acid-binding protein
MPDAVIDVSAMIEVLTSAQPDVGLRKRVLLNQLAAPELFDVEAAHVLRRLARAGVLSEPDAAAVLTDIGDAPIARAPHLPLMERVWQLRHSVTAYDATYIALAEHLDVPLVTCDAKLAASHGHDAKVELYPTT